MQTDDQQDVIIFLSRQPVQGDDAAAERIDTHISHVFLAGDRALKLKRAVRLPYADFSSPEKRLAACETELRLNRRTAPELYLRVRRITEGPEGPEFDGPGPLRDAVVEMVRFDQAALFDAMAARGALPPALLDALGREVAAFHAGAPVRHVAGGAENIRGVLDVNLAGFRQSGVFAETTVAALDARFREALARHAPLLDAREAAGEVRRCHGDLHLRNICLYQGRPRLFDCLEFNETLAVVDVLYDLAFLVMDLWHRGMAPAASRVANRYLDTGQAADGFCLMPFFVALRAAVRAHVTATQAATASAARAGLEAEAQSYFALARQALDPPAARLVAVGGLSGTGKSTLAGLLAPHLGAPPGARVLGSDRIRKALHGVDPDTKLPPEAYSTEVSARVYAELASRAEAQLAAGMPVIAEAVHDRAEDRARIEAVARAAGVPFTGLWLTAPAEHLVNRLSRRDPGASDADAEVLHAQLARSPEATGWHDVSTDCPVDESLAAARAAIEQGLTPA